MLHTVKKLGETMALTGVGLVRAIFGERRVQMRVYLQGEDVAYDLLLTQDEAYTLARELTDAARRLGKV